MSDLVKVYKDFPKISSMGGSCKDVCRQFTGAVLLRTGLGYNTRYSDGWVRCTECEFFIKTKELRCRCCHQLFRRKPKKQ